MKRYLVLLLLPVILFSCRANRQRVVEQHAVEQTAIVDSVVHAEQGRQRLTVQWWGEPPMAVVPTPPVEVPHEAPRSGGYSIELLTEEQSQSVSRDTQQQSSSTSYLAREQSEPNPRRFYLGLALGLSLFLLYLIYKAWRENNH